MAARCRSDRSAAPCCRSLLNRPRARCRCVVLSVERGFLEVKKFAVYLVVPVLTVIAYNHPTTHPYFGRHVRRQR